MKPGRFDVGSALTSAGVMIVLGSEPGLAEGQISFNGSVVLTSEYVHRGISQTLGKPAIQVSRLY